MKYSRGFSLIVFALLLGCQSTSKPRKAVVVSVEVSESNSEQAKVHVLHNVKTASQLRPIAKMAAKGILNCESGKMTQKWLADNSAPPHEEFLEGQNSVSLALNCVVEANK